MARVKASTLNVGDVIWDKDFIAEETPHPWVVIGRDDATATLTLRQLSSHKGAYGVIATIQPDDKTGEGSWKGKTSYVTDAKIAAFSGYMTAPTPSIQMLPPIIYKHSKGPAGEDVAVPVYGAGPLIPTQVLIPGQFVSHEVNRCGTIKPEKMAGILIAA